MILPRIQYITHPNENYEELSWVHRLHDGGIRWIQLRIKEEDFALRYPDKHFLAYFHEIADKMRVITSSLGILLTINDELEVALFSGADGLHIGLDDTAPSLANTQLPEGRIFGGTANSLHEMLHYKEVGLSYFGVGPFQTTETKKTSKPILGISGYQNLINSLKEQDLLVPIYAIGGITHSDVKQLLEIGVYGVAVSGAIFQQQHSPESIKIMVNLIKEYEFTFRR